jgi:DNA-binding transcriptional regulator GbsR (MarR family)
MHGNLRQIQERFVQATKETLEILEIRKVRPIIMAALFVSEKPLSEEEIAARTGLTLDRVGEEVAFLIEKEVLMGVSPKGGEGKTSYEVNPDIEKVLGKRVRSKAEKVLENTRKHIEESKKLLFSCESELDDFDRLMAKFLKCKMKKAEMFCLFLSRKMAFWDFLHTGEPADRGIKRIPIE